MPLPGTKVILPGWSAHHYAVARGQMTAQGTIVRPMPAVFDELLGAEVEPQPQQLYAGLLRIQRLAIGSAPVVVGDREVIVRGYQVTMPLKVSGIDTAAIQTNDIVTVTVNPDDPYLVGRPLRVRDVRVGSLVWQRDLVCEDIGPTTR